MDRQAVLDFVAAKGKPSVVSLAEDTHVFHFDPDGDWEASPVLLVNRNGHHFRLLEQPDGSWLYAKTWRNLFDAEGWETAANLKRTDATTLINLCGIGPQGNRGATFETLSLLPKEATRKRMAVWRFNMLDVWFDRGSAAGGRGADTFSLTLPGTGTRQSFSGKLWESRDAAKWCAENLSDEPKNIVTARATPAAVEKIAANNANHPLWGMF